jgi:hypothetical protein
MMFPRLNEPYLLAGIQDGPPDAIPVALPQDFDLDILKLTFVGSHSTEHVRSLRGFASGLQPVSSAGATTPLLALVDPAAKNAD